MTHNAIIFVTNLLQFFLNFKSKRFLNLSLPAFVVFRKRFNGGRFTE